MKAIQGTEGQGRGRAGNLYPKRHGKHS